MTTNLLPACAALSDREVLSRVDEAVRDERVATARLIALLIELDTRRLYLGEGCSSLFTYCTQVLRLSEHAAYNRIETARAARRFPVILDLVESSAVTLTTVRLLSPHLTEANHHDVLECARHKSKRDVELLVATLSPRPDVPSVIRKLPESRPAVISSCMLPAPSVGAPPEESLEHSRCVTAAPIPCRPAEIKPLAPERYKVQCTVSRETYDKLRRVQDLMRHTTADGDLSTVLDRALTVLLAELERKKFAATDRPRGSGSMQSRSRHIPAAVKREVWTRDGGRCAFQGEHGPCAETGFLEFHHVIPYADGGQTSVGNLELRCRAHNQYEAELWSLCAPEPPALFGS